MRWFATVEIENKEFTFCRINTGSPSLLIGALFVANVAWRIAVRAENCSRLCQHRSPRMVDQFPHVKRAFERFLISSFFEANVTRKG
jgi:hypothetical protein